MTQSLLVCVDGQVGTTNPSLATAREQAAVQAAGRQHSRRNNFYLPCTGEVLNGLSLDSLSSAISQIESRGSGESKAVGIYTCADG